MPSSSSPFDDPLADLFGKLPDPRGRAGVARSAPSPASSATGPPSEKPADEDPDAPADETASEPHPVSPAAAATGDRPLSRRDARRSAAAASPSVTPAQAPTQAPTPSPAPPPAEATAPASRPAATAPLDALFTGEATSDDLGAPPPPPDKRRRRRGGWIILALLLALIGGIGVGVAWVWNTYEEPIREFMGWEEPQDYEEGEATGEAMVTVISGDNGRSISQTLFDAGVTKTPDAFYDYLIDTRQNPPFQPGVYLLQQKMTSAAALTALLDPAKKQSNTAQLREGLTVEQSLPLLADGLGLPIEDFQAAVANPADYGVSAASLEGWLFPATYTFDPGATAADVIRTLVDRTIQSLDSAGVPVERREEILTIASIIEREARFEEDFYKVSRVIQNRLAPGNTETFGLLQMDSTAQYGYQEMHDGTVSSSREALEDDNPWNTYVHPGLPVGPIANPGDLAIDAAMHPADGPWMYFVTVNLDTGETIFTNTGAEHEQAVKQWQQWCADNPDSGC
ncbi:endolytic transglycosylase MltG [Microbacterium sp. zg-Y818]|uniref:endolytic transglycosylase MltG n=1 Tax=unclassified Microbacterium TaxID=2609290 RepID=UPI00214B50E8|nr:MULTISPECIES: endolytic transglycosylase MltG [unclassified Microbacterium]MCR2800838.1 endolytic transglycosylase MltG [Microbacterium sp. zg.Y818]WIM23555.1 endolytic transglycosylase MltG [Microbacterium sp. zg-Y818]